MPQHLFRNHIIPTSISTKRSFKMTYKRSKLYYPHSLELSINGTTKTKEADQRIQLLHKVEDPQHHYNSTEGTILPAGTLLSMIHTIIASVNSGKWWSDCTWWQLLHWYRPMNEGHLFSGSDLRCCSICLRYEWVTRVAAVIDLRRRVLGNSQRPRIFCSIYITLCDSYVRILYFSKLAPQLSVFCTIINLYGSF